MPPSVRPCCLAALCLTTAMTLFAAGPGSLPADDRSVAESMHALGPGAARTETDHFVVIGDADPAWSQSTGVLLETTYDRFARLMRHLSLPLATPTSKLQCILIKDHDRFVAFARAQDGIDAGWMGGYYATQTNRIVFYDSETSPEFIKARDRLTQLNAQADRARKQAGEARREKRAQAEEVYRTFAAHARDAGERQRRLLADRAAQAGAAKTTHEAAHLLAFNCGLQLRSRQYPFWLSEGLATCFEAESADAARRGLFGPDRDNPVRQREFAAALSEGTLIPLETLIEMIVPDPDEDTARVMYAQAHSLYRWLHRYERQSLAGLYADIAREPAGHIAPRRHGELFRARFGSTAKLERRWLHDAGAEALKLAAASDEP
ncbi:MAG: DUF1570 domain-containing protein [Phycisphaerae bacterium]|nr:DUF1570 domain-containing protein [Phycisphaerae bacterium]